MSRKGICFQCNPAISLVLGSFSPPAVSFHRPPPKPLLSPSIPTMQNDSNLHETKHLWGGGPEGGPGGLQWGARGARGGRRGGGQGGLGGPGHQGGSDGYLNKSQKAGRPEGWAGGPRGPGGPGGPGGQGGGTERDENRVFLLRRGTPPWRTPDFSIFWWTFEGLGRSF